MAPQKGDHHILADDRVWGGLKMMAGNRGFRRISDYLEPLHVEILHLENEGQDPLAILRRARKKREVT